jgi:uncharacterized protein YeaO (DUF488 family)
LETARELDVTLAYAARAKENNAVALEEFLSATLKA